MKIKLLTLSMLLAVLLCPPLTAAAEEPEEIPYPPRNFLYVVDCSGSMQKYGDALDVGRTMLRDLLPASTTTVIAFNASASVVTDKLTFGGETSVLAGLEKADLVLEKQRQEIQDDGAAGETTVLLFSDMQSTVRADDGETRLTDDAFQEENQRLQVLEDRWSQRILDGDLRFYSLRWWSAEEEDTYTVVFDPSRRTAGNPQRFELDSAQEILKTCVEAYACVLTGSSEFRWTESKAVREGGALRVPVEESYRTFLYLPQAPSRVFSPTGSVIDCKKWPLPMGGSMLMLENTKAGTYLLEGEAESCLCLTIPQPRLTVKSSPTPAMCGEAVTISVALSAGDSYLGYDTSNSLCLMEICPPQERVIPVPSTYDQEQNCYKFVYTPQTQGAHEVRIRYLIQNGETIDLEAAQTLEIEPYEIRLRGDAQRNYEGLLLYLQTRLREGDEFSFALSDYFQTPYRRLEFIVPESETPESVYWDSSSDERGQVTIRALRAGTALLRCEIAYYKDGAPEPEHTQTVELPIRVGETPPRRLPVLIPVGAVGLAIAIAACALILRREKVPREDR